MGFRDEDISTAINVINLEIYDMSIMKNLNPYELKNIKTSVLSMFKPVCAINVLFRSKRLCSVVMGLLFLSIFTTLMIYGCSSKETQKEDPFLEEWRQKAIKHVGHSPTADRKIYDFSDAYETSARKRGSKAGELDDEDTKVVVKKPVEKPLPKQNVTIEKMKAPAAVLLRTMARAAGVNIIINENVTGQVNMDIKDAPWDQVFLAVLNSHGLTYTFEGDIIRVISVKDYEAELELLNARRSILAKKQEYDISSLSMERKLETVEPFQTKVIQVKFADTEELKKNLEIFLGNSPGEEKNKDGNKGASPQSGVAAQNGSISVDKHTNSLIVQARPKEMKRIISLISKLDKPVPQVLIKAYIVEATSDTAKALGIQWGGLYHGGGEGEDTNYWITPGTYANKTDMDGAGTGVSPLDEDGRVNPSSGYGVNFPVDLSGGSGLSIGYVAEYLGEHILAVQLSALEESDKINILSNPSITTLDNQSAIIKSGREVPYRAYEEGAVSIKWREAVLSLEVTPHIIDENTLKLEINTTKDEIDQINDVDGNPIIIKKAAQTKVVLFDGQTTVIGGLKKETLSNSEAGVPGLQDVSVLGNLFKSDTDSSEMEELLIFITPYILKARPVNVSKRDVDSPTMEKINAPSD